MQKTNKKKLGGRYENVVASFYVTKNNKFVHEEKDSLLSNQIFCDRTDTQILSQNRNISRISNSKIF